MKDLVFNLLFKCIAFVGILFLISPLCAFFTFSWSTFKIILMDSFVLDALWISLKTTMLSLLVIMIIGIPMAYVMNRFDFYFKESIQTFIQLPLVLPPAVAGILLLVTFGRYGWIGKYLSYFDIQIPFTMISVCMAQIFVALPIFVETVQEGFRKIDQDLEGLAQIFGANHWNVFIRVLLPLGKGSIFTGAVLSFARALGEFGATMVFAGNLAGKTQTLPLAIYTAMEQDISLSMGIAICLVILSMSILFIVKWMTKKAYL